MPCKLVANAVGGRKIAALTRGLAFGNQRVDLGVAGSGGVLAEAKRAKFFRVVVLQYRENRVERFERGENGRGVALAGIRRDRWRC